MSNYFRKSYLQRWGRAWELWMRSRTGAFLRRGTLAAGPGGGTLEAGPGGGTLEAGPILRNIVSLQIETIWHRIRLLSQKI